MGCYHLSTRNRYWIATLGLLLVASGIATTPTCAQNPTGAQSYELLKSQKRLLSVGDVAPPLTDAECLIGDLPKFNDAKVIVVDFWATWSQPYEAMMPERSTLKRQYNDQVQIIAITAEPKQTVKRFLEGTGDYGQRRADAYDFSIAIDKDNSTSNLYVRDSGAWRPPVSFIIGRDGKIEWMGSPTAVPTILPSVVDGTWDREAYRLTLAQERKEIQRIAKDRRTIEEAARAKNWPVAFAVLDQLIADSPGLPEPKMVKAGYLRRAGLKDDAVLLMKEVVQECWDDHGRLAMLATFFSERILPGDATLALKAANRACDLKPQEAEYWSILARAEQLSGNFTGALSSQRKALALDPGSRRRAEQLVLFEELASQ